MVSHLQPPSKHYLQIDLWPSLLFHSFAGFTNISYVAYLDVDEVNEIRRNEKNRKTKKVTKKQKTQGRENSEKIFIDRNVDMGKRAMQAGDSMFRRLNSADSL